MFDVALWHFADINRCRLSSRYRGQSRHRSEGSLLRLLSHGGHGLDALRSSLVTAALVEYQDGNSGACLCRIVTLVSVLPYVIDNTSTLFLDRKDRAGGQ